MIRWLKGIYHLLVAIASTCYFRFPGSKLTVIGVTGTDGKTTTSTLIYHILKESGKKVSMITSVHAVIAGKSYDTGFHVTTPTAFWVQKYLREAVDHGDAYMVLEVTSHALTQHRVWGIPFAIGVLTNITHEHLDWHKTFDAYVKAKSKLLKASKTVVVNKDDGNSFEKIGDLVRTKELITYGIRRTAKVSPETHAFHTKLPGEFNIYNCLAAFAVAQKLDIPFSTIRKAIQSFSGVKGRMEVVTTTPCQIIVDFAHTPNALTQALRTVKDSTKGKLIHIFGSAGLRDKTKRPYMGKASSEYADVIIITEEDYRTEKVEDIIDQIASGIPSYMDIYRYPDRKEAIRFALSIAKKDDTILITGKGHEKSLCRGTIEYPWSDQDMVMSLLSEKKS